MTPEAARAELEEFGRFYGALAAQQHWGEHVCCAAQPQDANGSVEDVFVAGVEDAVSITGRWAAQIVEAVSDRSSVNSIQSAIGGLQFDLDELARVIERSLVHSAMLGVLDAEWEREHGEEIEPAVFAAPRLAEGAFSSLPYADAVRIFQQSEVLPKRAFDALEDGAKRTAFTVARMASEEMLNVTKAELAKQLNQARARPVVGEDGVARRPGLNLRNFERFAKDRLESAGWTPANKSHVETIFRTNTVGALASGRFVEMRKPENLRALPFWQIRGVDDSRTRPTHKAAFNIVLPATHPFWRTAYPPFGFSCRCRTVARTLAYIKRHNLPIGPVPRGLPDPGFDSGTRVLIQVPDNLLEKQPPPAEAGPPTAPPARPPLPPPPIAAPPPPPPAPAPLPPDATELERVAASQRAARASPNPVVARAAQYAEALRMDPALVRRMGREQIETTFRGARSQDMVQGRMGRSLFEVRTDKQMKATTGNAAVAAWHNSESGQIVIKKKVRDNAAKAVDLLEKGVLSDPRLETLHVADVSPEFAKRFPKVGGKVVGPIPLLDGLKAVFHEELHGFSRSAGRAYSGIGAVLEEVGTELNARHVVQNLTPEIARNPVMRQQFSSMATRGAYQRQIDAVCDLVSRHAQVSREAAGELVREAHRKAFLSGGSRIESPVEHARAFCDALDVPRERAQLVFQELTR